MKPSTSIPGYLSIPKAAELFDVSDSLVRRWVRAGTLPHVMAGGKTRMIPIEAAKKFAKIERKRGPKPA